MASLTGVRCQISISMNSTVARTLQKRRLDSQSQAPAVGEPNGAPAEEAGIVEASMFVGLAIGSRCSWLRNFKNWSLGGRL